METNGIPGGVQPAGDSTGLLAEFGRWLGRERGLSPVSAQCYSKQSKAVPGLDRRGRGGQRPGRGKGDRVHGGLGAGSQHVDGEGNGDVAAVVPAIRPRHRPDGRPAGGRPSVACGGRPSLPRGMKATEIDRLLARRLRPGHGDGPAGLRDLVAAGPAGPAGAEAAGLQIGDIDWRAGEITVTGKGSKTERLPLPARPGRPWPLG